METINTTVGSNTPYNIIPDTMSNLLGYSTKSKAYTVLKGNNVISNGSSDNYRSVEELKTDPSYAGYITIEEPGNIISYSFEGEVGLDQITLNELVDVIKHYQMLATMEECS